MDASGPDYTVEVRPPLHRPSPVARLRTRWADRRRKRRDKNSGLDGVDLVGDAVGGLGDDIGAAIAVIAAAIAVILLVVVFGPYLLLLVVFAVEMAFWLAVTAAGVTAVFVLRRPWNVVVIDAGGEVVASATVAGRRAAAGHADMVRARLGGGMTPATAILTP